MRRIAIFMRFLIILLTFSCFFDKINVIFDYREAKRLDATLYEFEAIDCEKQNGYIFQYVKGRKLTDVYHLHDFYEVIWCLKGNGMQTINEKESLFFENRIVLLRPSDRHCFIRQSADIEILSVSVKKEEFERFANAYDLHLLKTIAADAMPTLFACEPKAFDIAKKSVTEYDCKLFLSFFLHEYIVYTKNIKKNTSLPPLLSLAIEDMKKEENLKKGIEAFTALSHYSHSHLARLIKAHFGMSLKRYVNELRLQCAYNNIVLSNESAEEIAENVGFSSFSHFSKIFKERFSTTPAALRKSSGAWTA